MTDLRYISPEAQLAAEPAIPPPDPSMDDLRALLAETQQAQREAAVKLAAWVRDNIVEEYGDAAALADAVLSKDRLQRRIRDQLVNEACG